MPEHKVPRTTTRRWDFTLRLPADKAAPAQDLIRSRVTDFLKLRKADDLKTAILASEVKFTPQPEEGGLQVFACQLELTHQTSIDYLSFPRLRAMLIATVPIPKAELHLEECKAKRAPAKAAPPEPKEEVKEEVVKVEPKAPEPAMVALAALEVKAPAPVALPPPAPKAAEIGLMIVPEQPPMKPKERKVHNKVTRANLAAAALPPAPAPELPPPTAAPAPAPAELRVFAPRKYDRVLPTTASPIALRSFGFRE